MSENKIPEIMYTNSGFSKRWGVCGDEQEEIHQTAYILKSKYDEDLGTYASVIKQLSETKEQLESKCDNLYLAYDLMKDQSDSIISEQAADIEKLKSELERVKRQADKNYKGYRFEPSIVRCELPTLTEKISSHATHVITIDLDGNHTMQTIEEYNNQITIKKNDKKYRIKDR